MEPNELEEFQGFTVAALRAWLIQKGWRDVTTPRQRQAAMGCNLVLVGEVCGDLWLPRSDAATALGWRWLFIVAEAVKLPLQELLRQVNPRLRSGWPSEDDLKTYARWLVRCPQLDSMMVVWGSDTMRERKERVPNAAVECWPVDAAGNKVRWK